MYVSRIYESRFSMIHFTALNISVSELYRSTRISSSRAQFFDLSIGFYFINIGCYTLARFQELEREFSAAFTLKREF